MSGRLVEAGGWLATLAQSNDLQSEEARYIVKSYGLAAATFTDPDPSRISDFDDVLEYFQHADDSRSELFIRLTIALLELTKSPPNVMAAEQHLRRASELAEQERSPFIDSMVLLIRGQTSLAAGDLEEATRSFTGSLKAARASGEAISESAALYHLGWLQMISGDVDGARDCFVQQLLIVSTVGNEEGIAIGLAGLFAASATSGDVERAGRFLGAAENIRERKGIRVPGLFAYHQPVLAQIEASPAAPVLAAARGDGRQAELTEVLEEAFR